MSKPIYILGTGLSHNGSAVLLKDGRICVGIEKERLSRIKHDGGNDSRAIQYCLDAEGIGLEDISLVVQTANFEIPDRDFFKGPRLFGKSEHPKVINISHHLAHAYSAVGTSPFSECAVMVIDGCGSPMSQFLQLHPEQKHVLASNNYQQDRMYCEKDSFYHFDGQRLVSLFKDFSEMSSTDQQFLRFSTTRHSIGGFYSAISNYVFGNMEDVGKLMGLAPYGKSGVFKIKAFEFLEGRLYVEEDWVKEFDDPSKSYDYFKEHFSYYADVARWAQEEVEKAVITCISDRLMRFPHEKLCYTGGVALNAVANAKLIDRGIISELYLEPAAGDNGLALGCAFYGWLEYFKRPKIHHNGSTCFGKPYDKQEVEKAISKHEVGTSGKKTFSNESELLQFCAKRLAEGKTLAWFQDGSEFGPRALGRRSILAHPGIINLKDHINKNIKFREDFRPFAPAVLEEVTQKYFVAGRKSPYMILVDQTKPKYLKDLANVTHVNGSARVQTVDASWNCRFAKLIKAFQKESGLAVLLNTSLNRKGMPIVETPEDALQLFKETALDILVIQDVVLEKTDHVIDQDLLLKLMNFVNKIGLCIIETELDDECILPGLKMGPNCIYLDKNRLKYPGDLLHEAGHLAVTPAALRPIIGTEEMKTIFKEEPWPGDGDEIAAILWSYAALLYLDISPEVVFHDKGYKNQSEWIIEQFKKQNYIGLNLLEWMGLCTSSKKNGQTSNNTFPHMIKWLRS